MKRNRNPEHATIRVRNMTCEKCRKPLYFNAKAREVVCLDPHCQPIPYALATKRR